MRDHEGCQLVEAMLRDDLDATRAQLRALQETVLLLSLEAMGFETTPGPDGHYPRDGGFPFLFGSELTVDRVNELLEPHGFPGMRLVTT